MKTVLKVALGLFALVVLLAGGMLVWAGGKSADLLSQIVETHRAGFPVPFPLDAAEREELGLSGEEADALALERAIERGRHLVASRYVCVECHGADLGGGVMVDDPVLGRLLGPNITMGSGSKTLEYTSEDWDRIVRHGVKPDGTPAAMPSEDFVRMSDQELSDVVAYVRSFPPVDNEVPAPSLGPLGKVLMATGNLPLSAQLIHDHERAHAPLPPPAEVNADFGQHVAAVCMGCHGQTLAGGPIAAGDPSWPPGANLTPHAEGLAEWSYEQFDRVMRTGVKPDGSAVVDPMTIAVQYTQNMTEVEMQALWAYLRSLEPLATPN